MDCVSDDGDVFIGYTATLRWKALSINYMSILERRIGDRPRSRTSLQKFTAPRVSGSLIEWSSKSLGVHGIWKIDSTPIERTIFESDIGDIQWRCIAPIAKAEIQIGEQRLIKGLGYAEHISITIPPSQLPIDQLRWGRYLSEGDHLTWIDWRGPHLLTHVFHNGAEIPGAHVSDDEVNFASQRLMISGSDRQTLREGALVNTALAMIPGIRNLFPRRILDCNESKWLSHGTMEERGIMLNRGWVIHEVVSWGQS